MNQQDYESSQFVFKKTEQSIRILSTLWDTRFKILIRFFKRKNNSGFLFFKSKPALQSELQLIFKQLENTNAREAKVLEIINTGTSNGLAILKKTGEFDGESKKLLGDQVLAYRNKILQIEEILKTYERQQNVHRDILSIEKELISKLDEQKLSLYMKRIELF